MSDIMPWTEKVAQMLDPEPSEFAKNPVGWVQTKAKEHLTRDQASILEALLEHRYVAVQSCHDVGKALHVDTELPTPTGWVRMGDVNVGDRLYDETGVECNVTAVSPVWDDRETFEVVFDNGDVITCAGEHEWSVLPFEVRRRGWNRGRDWRELWGETKTVDTFTLAAELRHEGGARNWMIPNTRAIQCDEPCDLDVDPYVLGYWLGDGCAWNGSISIGREDWEESRRLLREAGCVFTRESEYTGVNVVGLMTTIKRLGLYRNKHVPVQVHRASREVRLAVLQGLMDSDGSAAGNKASVGFGGHYGRQLRDDVADLARSFGWKTTCKTMVKRLSYGDRRMYTSYVVHFRPDTCVFRLPRKSAGFKPFVASSSRWFARTIVGVRRVESAPTRCVTVDSPSHLFLAGRGMVPTHNSFTASRAVGWWLDSHPVGEAFVVTTAPTSAQVGAILWREIGKLHRKADLLGYVTGSNEWKIGHKRGTNAELVAYGRKPQDYEMSAFQGIHARYVLVVIDEACGVAKTLYDAADALATNMNARVLAIGNPDDPSSHFETVCRPGSGWHVIRLDALTSPNFTREEVAKYPNVQQLMIKEGILPSTESIPDDLREMLISVEWVSERIKRWGVNSPLFTAKVRGLFPQVTMDTLINPHWVKLAQLRELTPTPTQAQMGVDVARYGADKSVIVLRQTGHCRVVHEIARGPVTEVAGLVQQVGYGMPQPAVLPYACIDDTGVGGGVTDILKEVGYPTLGIVVGGASVGELLPNGKPRFFNLRSQLWWNLREALAGKSQTGEDGWLDLDPDDDELAAQITNVKYRINRFGQIVVESKDDMKARGLDSPDRGDALCLALAPIAELQKREPDNEWTQQMDSLLTMPL